jgi:hypothetical protein
MISPTLFGRLKLSDFITSDQIQRVHDWEYLDETWTCEMVGFTQFCYTITQSSRLGALCIDVVNCPLPILSPLLKSLGLPVAMTDSHIDVIGKMGNPNKVVQFVKGRKTLEYNNWNKTGFAISVTALNKGELVHLSLLCADV